MLVLAATLLLAAPADDTKAFLDPANWDGRSDIWSIQDGYIIGHTKEDPKYNTFFVSKAKYSDFDLVFKTRLRDGVGNSGVQVRSTVTDPVKFRVAGPQVDIGKGYWGSLYGEGVGGMMQAADKELIAKHVKESEVNEYRVTCKGPRYTVVVNGQTFIDANFPTLPGKDKKPAPTEGVIAFQAHAGYPSMKVEFFDIRFTDLGKK